jgi:hypothetical protein
MPKAFYKAAAAGGGTVHFHFSCHFPPFDFFVVFLAVSLHDELKNTTTACHSKNKN